MEKIVDAFKNLSLPSTEKCDKSVCVAVTAASVLTALCGVLYSMSFRKYPVSKTGVVLLTGCSGGIGLCAAEYLARNTEYVVFATVRKPQDVDKLTALGLKNLKAMQLDVTEAESCERVLAAVREHMAAENLPFVALVNNAAINALFPAEFHPLEHAKKVFDVNFFGPLRLVQMSLPLLRANKGSRVVMLSSFLTSFPVPKGSVYGASKCALDGLGVSLRRELSPFDISVSLIEPGMISSQMHLKLEALTDKLLPDAEKNKEMKDIYNFLFSEEEAERYHKSMDKSSPPLTVAKSIAHAIQDPYPRTKYFPANYQGMPICCLSWVLWLLNDRWQDRLLASFPKCSKCHEKQL